MLATTKQPARGRGGVHALFAAAALALIVAALRLPSISHQAWQPRLAGIHSAILLELSRQAQQDADAGPRAKPLAPPALVQLEAGTPVHGRMRKRGPLPSLVELAAGRSAAELGYRDAWAAQRLAGSKPPFPSKWCAIMFNDKYKLIFLKCPKTAGNTLVGYFGLCIKDQRDTCLAFLDANNATELQRLVDVWQDYFVFGFTRNILARAISQYRYLTHFMHSCRLVPWGEFCADPFVLGDACHRAAAAGNSCCRQSPEHQYVHVLPQAHCFTTANNESAVDWLGRVEHFEEDFRELLQLLNSRPGVLQLPPPANLSAVNKPAEAPCTPSGRQLLGEPLDQGSAVWQLREGIFNPCDPLDHFRGVHAHCQADLARFFHEDFSFLHTTQQLTGDAAAG
ncbi:hypothetical protein COHA_005202 [Chlorella ohadii]|uniref:Sulfotransferase n=1 Tax=Chlorella ohadii TaxID=2649997 RepID=A0AAD5DR22_9CHLO|nr:hypothetical protein COHA_005202 [Chlorella ohadii]